ncbi:MAG TPA: YicC/YloC family endoribonuclease [Woeseiaceae bacterium]|nr:YicC/YloC family endoribonuclease [Woeseiaceae bacterium]
MTGFARRERQTEFGDLAWEVRSVNHRYLDLQFRLPDVLRGSEAEFRRAAGERLGRGKVDLALSLRRNSGARRELAVDEVLIGRIAEGVAVVRERFGETGAVDPLEVLRWPGVIEDQPVQRDALLAESLDLLDEALATLDEMRRAEGARLAETLANRTDEVARIAAAVRARRPEVLAGIEQKLRERLGRLEVEAEPGRLETELAIIAQKMDVEEELDRLDSHVEALRSALGRDEPVGRRLDFLMQEFNREANTLGSKSGDAETTRASVELKVLIEQMREQIQNIE